MSTNNDYKKLLFRSLETTTEISSKYAKILSIPNSDSYSVTVALESDDFSIKLELGKNSVNCYNILKKDGSSISSLTVHYLSSADNDSYYIETSKQSIGYITSRYNVEYGTIDTLENCVSSLTSVSSQMTSSKVINFKYKTDLTSLNISDNTVVTDAIFETLNVEGSTIVEENLEITNLKIDNQDDIEVKSALVLGNGDNKVTVDRFLTNITSNIEAGTNIKGRSIVLCGYPEEEVSDVILFEFRESSTSSNNSVKIEINNKGEIVATIGGNDILMGKCIEGVNGSYNSVSWYTRIVNIPDDVDAISIKDLSYNQNDKESQNDVIVNGFGIKALSPYIVNTDGESMMSSNALMQIFSAGIITSDKLATSIAYAADKKNNMLYQASNDVTSTIDAPSFVNGGLLFQQGEETPTFKNMDDFVVVIPYDELSSGEQAELISTFGEDVAMTLNKVMTYNGKTDDGKIERGSYLKSPYIYDGTNIHNLVGENIKQGTVNSERLPVASSTEDGIINIGTQTIAGYKTFINTITGNIDTASKLRQDTKFIVDLENDNNSTVIFNGEAYSNDSSNGSGSSVDSNGLLTIRVTNTLPVKRGGTGNASLNTNAVLVGNGTDPITYAKATGGEKNHIYINSNGEIVASSTTVGGETQSMYMSNGTLTPSTTTVGSATKPMWMNNGMLTAFTGSIGSGTKIMYMSAGSLVESSSTVGATNKPVYMNAGVITASTSTIGSSIKPIYMSAGSLMESSSTIGATNKPVYMNAGTITASSSTIGSGIKPIYMSTGSIVESSSTVGAANKPVYMSSGVITASASTIGSSTKPVYMNAGTITEISSISGIALSSITSLSFSSDIRVKDNLEKLNFNVLDKLSDINIYTYNYKNDKDRSVLGVVAQELEEAIPELKDELVHVERSEEFDLDDMRTVEEAKLVFVALKAVQELTEENKQLKERLAKIEKMLGIE